MPLPWKHSLWISAWWWLWWNVCDGVAAEEFACSGWPVRWICLSVDRCFRPKIWDSLSRTASRNNLCVIMESPDHNWNDDVIKWKQFPRYWPFVRGIYRSPVNSPHKSQWCGVLMFSLIYAGIDSWVNNREVGDLRYHRAHYDVDVMGVAIKLSTIELWLTHWPLNGITQMFKNIIFEWFS